jgi:GNAT superfamily N-acetyltransferase
MDIAQRLLEPFWRVSLGEAKAEVGFECVDGDYFNHSAHVAETRWQRREMLGQWWRIYRRDTRWAPPFHPALRHTLTRDDYALTTTRALTAEAMPKRDVANGWGMEAPVAAAAVRTLPGETETAYLTMLHLANDRASLRALLEAISKELRPQGYRTLKGPAALSPYLARGVLASHWNRTPPLHTPYNPPYVLELCYSLMQPEEALALYHIEVTDLSANDVQYGSSFEPSRLTTDRLPLLQAATETSPLPPISAKEAKLLLSQLAPFSLHGSAAEAGGQSIGFALLQADESETLRRANGGRGLWGKLAFQLPRKPATHGRLLLGGVLPQYRRQGWGTRLLQRSLSEAKRLGWESLSVGPVPTSSAAAHMLEACGASAEQRYQTFSARLSSFF